MKLKSIFIFSLLVSPFAFISASSASSDANSTHHAAHDMPAGEMNIMAHHSYARATPPGAVNSAVFMHLMNHSKQDQVIVSASTSAAGKVELHDVITEGDVMKMRQISRLVIPAEGMLELRPGGLHIMLFDLKKPLVEDETIDVELTLESGEQYSITAPIKKVMSGMKHKHH
ncbi:copper chaperone PCu(A)C [uncultured Vibrio sp.]|uniref:copper chaperone PCu(A)C n=1 Tax=uncultured Vibrio sp. TaxID=114054 RepID=UPI0025E2EAF1|nr:copper chaperone PCu(A)C [uncultured Vibrio sp.]